MVDPGIVLVLFPPPPRIKCMRRSSYTRRGNVYEGCVSGISCISMNTTRRYVCIFLRGVDMCTHIPMLTYT